MRKRFVILLILATPLLMATSAGLHWKSFTFSSDGTNTSVTTAILFPNGTAALPSVAGTNFTSSGLFWTSGPVLGVSISGTQVGTFSSTALTVPSGYTVVSGSNTLIGSVADKLNASHLAIASQAIGDLLYASSTTAFARLAAVGSGQVLASAGVGAAPVWSSSPTLTGLTLTGGTVTTSTPLISGTQTFSGAGAFTGVLFNFTCTTCATTSKLLDLQKASTSQFFVDQAGLAQITSGLAIGATAYGQSASGHITMNYSYDLRTVNFAGGGVYGLIASGGTAVNSVDIGSGSSGIYFLANALPSADNNTGLGSATLNFTGLFLGTSVNSVKVKGGASGFQIRNGADAADAALTASTGTFSGLTANTAIVAGAGGLIQSVAAVTNGVLVSGAPPTFSATPTVTSVTANTSFTLASGAAIVGVGNMLYVRTAPTISSGFGTTPSIDSHNGSGTFRVNVGTGGTATSGVVGMPTATTGWNCFVEDQTTANVNTRQTASTATSVTFGTTVAWAASDILVAVCMAY